MSEMCSRTKFPDGTRCGDYGWHAKNCLLSTTSYTVQYEGIDITLTAAEYSELKNAAQFDPQRAQEIALEHLSKKEM